MSAAIAVAVQAEPAKHGANRKRKSRCIAACDDRERRRTRASKREYMRRWRTDPANRDRERLYEAGIRESRKLRDLQRDAARSTVNPKICGCCRRLKAVTKIERMRATEEGFAPVVVPYCGQC